MLWRRRPHKKPDRREAECLETELVIETVGLRMRYGSKDVLGGIDLQVQAG